ncbi:nuclear pore complex subunit Nro1-domain-containing protein [Powellomyces hirtus]|nr:nuclear pore complex subunit Nro1-domain-containing protein [Powellomyces hirtus]
MPPKKKQPRGLKRSLAKPANDAEAPTDSDSSNKRIKTEDNPVVPPKSEADAAPAEDTRTVEIDADEEDEVGILKSLFDTAVAKHESGDIEGAEDLFRGCVHECDKILRIHDGAIPPSSDSPADAPTSTDLTILAPLSSEFHLVYGNALLQLGLCLRAGQKMKDDVKSDDSFMEYLREARERLEIGLEWAIEEKADEFRIRATLCRVCLEQATECYEVVENGTNVDGAKTFVSAAKNFFDIESVLVRDFKSEENNALLLSTVLDFGSSCQRYGDVLESWEGTQEWVGIAQKLFEKVLDASSSTSPLARDALAALGGCSLCLAIHQLEDDAEEHDPAVITRQLEEGLSYFERAEKLAGQELLSTPSVPLLLLMGECLVNLGNMYDQTNPDGNDDTRSEEMYKRAIECFNMITTIDATALPPQFAEFVNEWEKDLAAEDVKGEAE